MHEADRRNARGRRVVRLVDRDSQGFLRVTIPAVLASGAHQMGEEAQVYVYFIGRALDTDGSGRVSKLAIGRELRRVYPGGKINRVFEHVKGVRYWALEGNSLRLRGQVVIAASFECELVDSAETLTFSLAILDRRSRRSAALLAAIVATAGAPRSDAFIQRFSKVDKKTRAAWKKDLVIVNEILRRCPEWIDR